jgi:outer membrane protein
MLKHLIRLISLALVLIFGTSVSVAASSAPTPAAAPAAPAVQSTNPETPPSLPTKIGVLDWQQLLAKAPQAEEAGKRLEQEFKTPKDNLLKKQKDFQAKQEKLGRDKDVMSEAERKKIENELTKMQQDLRRQDEELRSDYTARHQEEMSDFLKVVREVVDTLAKEKKFDLVLPQDATIYMADRVNVTDDVLESLRKLKTQTKTDKSDKTKH